MNSWLKVALYSFIGVIIGSFALGIIAPGYDENNMNMIPGQMQMNGMNAGQGQMQMNMMRNMGGRQGGMGMM